MEYLIIIISSVAVAALTLFSGFGLGTLLMPVFAIFYPAEIAIAATAVVHLANNIFKILLVGRHADFKVVFKFAVPAALAAILGAYLLNYFSGMEPIYHYSLGSKQFEIVPIKMMIGLLIIAFAVLDLIPFLNELSIGRKYLPLGGVISGFFGGLSGHQGALRVAFLKRLGLTKEVFVGTTVACAVLVDLVRIAVYGATFVKKDFGTMAGSGTLGLVAAGTAAAFLGSFIGARMLKKITMDIINRIVGVMLMLMGLALAMGVI